MTTHEKSGSGTAAAPDPTPGADRTGIDFFGHFLRAYPRRTGLMIGLLILAGLAEGVGLVTLMPLLEVASGESGGAGSSITAAITDALRSAGIAPTFEMLLLIIVVMMCLKGAFLWLAMRQVGYTVAQVETDMRLQLIRALMSAEWSYFVRHPTGHFTNSISTEAHRATSAYRQGCSALASLVQIVVFSVVVFLVSWKIALASFVVGVALVYALRGFIRMSRAAGNTQTRVMKSLVARLTEAVPGIKPIKAMARESQLLPLLEEETEGYKHAQRQNVLAVETRRAFQEPLLVIVIAVGLWVLVGLGNQPLSAVLVLAAIFYRLMQTLNQLQSQYQDMVLNESALWSMREQIDQAEAAREVLRGTTPPPALVEGIRFENVSFSHPGTRVFDNLSLDLPAGRLIAVSGPSGAGKTTLIDLAVGLLRPGAGRVLLDGVPLDEIDARAWRGTVGYVPQEIMLFQGSILRNVSLGDPTISQDAVVEALQRAGAWDFVSRMPHGLESPVGERGSQLSGGQRQRIAIARALVSRPRLLVLDEGTAALDPETERGICETLRSLRGEVTILAISHQAAMSEVADMIVRVSSDGVTIDAITDDAVLGRARA